MIFTGVFLPRDKWEKGRREALGRKNAQFHNVSDSNLHVVTTSFCRMCSILGGNIILVEIFFLYLYISTVFQFALMIDGFPRQAPTRIRFFPPLFFSKTKKGEAPLLQECYYDYS